MLERIDGERPTVISECNSFLKTAYPVFIIHLKGLKKEEEKHLFYWIYKNCSFTPVNYGLENRDFM